MKALIIIYFIYQILSNQSNSLDLQLNLDSTKYVTVIETVKVLVEGKSPNTENYGEGKNFLNQLVKEPISITYRVILSIFLILFAGYINNRLSKFYNKYKLSNRLKNADFLKIILHILIWVVTTFIIIFTLIKSWTFLVILFLIFIFSILLISVSDLFKNFIGGILILVDKPFEYGDWIKVDEYSGKVYTKNLWNTEIITEDDSVIKIPNSYFITKAFENLNVISKNKQISFIVEVQPKSEISKIKESLQEIVFLSIYNSINKPVEVIYKGINERGKMEFQIKAYVFDAKYENEFKSNVQESIAEIFGIN